MASETEEFAAFIRRHSGDNHSWELGEDKDPPASSDIHFIFHTLALKSIRAMMTETLQDAVMEGGGVTIDSMARGAQQIEMEAASIACGSFGLGIRWGMRVAVEAMEHAASLPDTPPPPGNPT